MKTEKFEKDGLLFIILWIVNSLIGSILHYLLSTGSFIWILACWIVYMEIFLILSYLVHYLWKLKISLLIACLIMILMEGELIDWMILLALGSTIAYQRIFLHKTIRYTSLMFLK